MLKGFKHTIETRQKIKEARARQVFSDSPDLKLKRSQIAKKAGIGSWMKGRKLSDITRQKISLSRKGKPSGMLGKHHSEKTRQKIREHNLLTGRRPPLHKGKDCHTWKGGITPLNRKIRNSVEYKLWRTAVFERDNYTCIWCRERGGELNADHIKPFAYFPELRLAIDNGRTLCKDCHRKTDSWGKRCEKNYQDLVDWGLVKEHKE